MMGVHHYPPLFFYMNINIKTIPHSEQRYPTCGDWWFEGDNLEIRISDMKNWKYELLVAIHEIVEVSLCKNRGITTEQVDNFDKGFEKLRESNPELIGNTEPGAMPSAPYFKEHLFATYIEQLISPQLQIDFQQYEKTIDSL